jgi:hypothetical protein
MSGPPTKGRVSYWPVAINLQILREREIFKPHVQTIKWQFQQCSHIILLFCVLHTGIRLVIDMALLRTIEGEKEGILLETIQAALLITHFYLTLWGQESMEFYFHVSHRSSFATVPTWNEWGGQKNFWNRMNMYYLDKNFIFDYMRTFKVTLTSLRVTDIRVSVTVARYARCKWASVCRFMTEPRCARLAKLPHISIWTRTHFNPICRLSCRSSPGWSKYNIDQKSDPLAEQKQKLQVLRSVVSIAMKIEILIFWVMTICSFIVVTRGTHFLYLQNEAVGTSQISVINSLWNHAVS